MEINQKIYRLLKQNIVLAVIMLLSIYSLHAEIYHPVKWKFELRYPEPGYADIYFKAKIEKNWHIYSNKIIGTGPVPTSVQFKTSDDYSLIDSLVEVTKAEIKYDPGFSIEVGTISNMAIFRQRIKISTKQNFSVMGSLEYMTCDNEKCLPPEDIDFNITVQVLKKAVSLPEKQNADSSNSENHAGNSFISKPVKEKSPIPPVISASYDDMSYSSLWMLFWLSFLAGIFAIFTPCVFPMIPMTVSFFLNEKQSKAKSRIKALMYGLSIIFIYVIIGTVVAITLGANFANFLSTHWIPNVLFFIIFSFFAASLFGMFEIVLPASWINKADQQADKGGLFSSFFMAFTLVVVSFSCTGPLVGAILVKSAAGHVLEPIVGMLGFSIAFALPFTFFAFFPGLLSNLPKSGSWLNSVKVILGFIELALGLKFLSVADQTYHWHLLDRDVYLLIWIILSILLGLYMLGVIKTAHDGKIKHIGVIRWLLAVIAFVFALYLSDGFFGAPLKALSGYLPPQTSRDFLFTEKLVSGGGNICEKPKNNDIFEIPHGLIGYFDYDQALKCSKQLKKPLFIDFTGHGCVNCRKMEANVWSDPEVLEMLRRDYIIVALYVDDKTNLPETEWVVSTYDGKVKKSIGKKYADFQISRYKINAQPFYVLQDSEGKDLVQPKTYDLNVGHFIEFLKEGLKKYNR